MIKKMMFISLQKRIIKSILLFAIVLLTSYFSEAYSAPVMSSPTPGSTLSQSTQTFTWDENGTNGILQWYLYIGTTGAGSTDVYVGSQGLNTSATIPALPTDGSTLYLRLWYRIINWQSIDVTYTACNGCASTQPFITMTDPTDGSTFLESYQTFNWQASNVTVLEWYLYVGTSVGNNSIYSSSQGTATQVTVSGLPTNGSTIFVRLWYRTTNGWAFRDLTYTSCSGACINLPHFSLEKSASIISDGINAANPKRIPGAIIKYTITATNTGLGIADAGTVIVNDPIPPDTDYIAGSLQFLANTSGLNASATLNVTATNIQVIPQGTFSASNGTTTPSFQITFNVKVK